MERNGLPSCSGYNRGILSVPDHDSSLRIGGGGYRYRVEIHGVGIIKPNYRMLDMCINIIALKRREERERDLLLIN